MQARKEQFKQGIDAETATAQRADRQQSLRKRDRQRKLNQRRQREESPTVVHEVLQQMEVGEGAGGDAHSLLAARLPELLQGISQQQDQALFTQSLEWLRVISASEYIEPTVFGSAQFLTQMAAIAAIQDAQIADKAITILTNCTMIRGAMPNCLEHGKVLQIASALLSNQQTPTVLVSSAAWLVANVVTTDYRVRDTAISMGIADGLARWIGEMRARYAQADFWPREATDLMENGYWALSNFFKGREMPRWDLMSEPMAAARAGLFEDESQREILGYVVWAIGDAVCDMLIQESVLRDQEMVSRLCLLTMGPDATEVRLGALKALGTLCTYEQRTVETPEFPQGQLMCPPLEQVMLGAQIINALNTNLSSPNGDIRYECCFIAANLALTAWVCVEELHQGGVIQRLTEMCHQELSRVRGEAMRAMCNVVHACIQEGSNSAGQRMYTDLIHGQTQVIRLLTPGLVSEKPSVREEVVRVFLNMIRRGGVTSVEQNNGVAIVRLFEESGAYEAIENMQMDETMVAIERIAVDCYDECRQYMEKDEEGGGEMQLDLTGDFTPLNQSGAGWGGVSNYSF
jgi:hypothetical protein